MHLCNEGCVLWLLGHSSTFIKEKYEYLKWYEKQRKNEESELFNLTSSVYTKWNKKNFLLHNYDNNNFNAYLATRLSTVVYINIYK